MDSYRNSDPGSDHGTGICPGLFSRFQSIATIKKLTGYADGYDLYRMDIRYDYDLDRRTSSTITSDQMLADALLATVFPCLPIHLELPDYSCSAFAFEDTEGNARLVLDRAATTQGAVDLLRGYDMFAVSGGDYHFYISDASNDTRIVEYDCHSETRELIDTPVRAATNFYEIYKDRVLPNHYNGIYGHGRERYDRIEEVLTEKADQYSEAVAWEALQAAQQLANPDARTSNTQWSVVYDKTNLTAKVVLRRNWSDITTYSLAENDVK